MAVFPKKNCSLGFLRLGIEEMQAYQSYYVYYLTSWAIISGTYNMKYWNTTHWLQNTVIYSSVLYNTVVQCKYVKYSYVYFSSMQYSSVV